jgi:hypothetical protein
MMPQSPRTRATIEGGPEGLKIVIPARSNLFALIFLGIWLVGWCMGEATAIARVASTGKIAEDPLLLMWLTVWTVGGCVAVYSWLWMLAGKEHLLMGSSVLRMKRDILGLGRTRTYELFKIRNLRVATQPAVPRNSRSVFRPWGLTGGPIAFDFEGEIIRFGGPLDPGEAQMIVDRMRQRFAFPEMPITS